MCVLCVCMCSSVCVSGFDCECMHCSVYAMSALRSFAKACVCGCVCMCLCVCGVGGVGVYSVGWVWVYSLGLDFMLCCMHALVTLAVGSRSCNALHRIGFICTCMYVYLCVCVCVCMCVGVYI